MKTHASLALAALTALGVTVAQHSGSEPDAAPAPTSIGLFDSSTILTETSLGKQMQKELAEIQEGMQRQLEQRQLELQKLATEVAALAPRVESGEVSRMQYDAKVEAGQKMEAAIQAFAESLDRQFSERQSEKLQEIGKEIEARLEAIGQKEGIELFLDSSTMQYYLRNEALDVTSKVVDAMGR